ncbi:MAG: hypothetical protein ACOCRK_07215 [bacterium]
MSTLSGVYTTKTKNGLPYFRSSITYNNKHISLGSFNSSLKAHYAYLQARAILFDNKFTFKDYDSNKILSFNKWIILHNFRDNGYYIKTPIYLHKYYFSYFLSPKKELKFDAEELFYYSHHKIFQRDGYLFVNDYGMQINILSRYGIKNHAVKGKDYFFKDGDSYNFRLHNLEVINPYYGVSKIHKNNKILYEAKIHINGNYIIGRYPTEEEAAIAYNRICDYLRDEKNITKNYYKNYILNFDKLQYYNIYNNIKIPKNITML